MERGTTRWGKGDPNWTSRKREEGSGGGGGGKEKKKGRGEGETRKLKWSKRVSKKKAQR